MQSHKQSFKYSRPKQIIERKQISSFHPIVQYQLPKQSRGKPHARWAVLGSDGPNLLCPSLLEQVFQWCKALSSYCKSWWDRTHGMATTVTFSLSGLWMPASIGKLAQAVRRREREGRSENGLKTTVRGTWRGADWDSEGGCFSASSKRQNLTPFIASIPWFRSIWTCATNIAGTGPTRPSGWHELTLGQVSCYAKEASSGQNSVHPPIGCSRCHVGFAASPYGELSISHLLPTWCRVSESWMMSYRALRKCVSFSTEHSLPIMQTALYSMSSATLRLVTIAFLGLSNSWLCP